MLATVSNRLTFSARPAGDRALRPTAAPTPSTTDGQATAAGAFRVGALVLAVIGVFLAAFTTASLASGMSTVWTGMTLAIGGAVLAFAGRTGRATKIVCVVLATLAIVSAIYGNRRLDQKRLEISNILNGG